MLPAGSGRQFRQGARLDVSLLRKRGWFRSRRITILVVEDDASVRQLVGAMLRSSGYAVVAPAAPQEALALCADPGTRIDLLLTDMVLPETDGAAIAEAAQRSRPGLRVLFMSGYTEHAVLRRNPMDGNALFLAKPFTKAALLAKVREALE